LNGLVSVLERYRVSNVVFRDIDLSSETYQHWLHLLDQEGAAVHQGQAGMSLTLDEGLELVVLHPGLEDLRGTEADVNNNSVVARLVYGQVSVLLTGDIEAEVEGMLLAQDAPLSSTILKVAHHGSCGSTTPAFLAAVNPQVAVISVGADNYFGHPCDEVLERLRDVPVYRTDELGTVELTTDGTAIWANVAP
jgi:competence protein ComEC